MRADADAVTRERLRIADILHRGPAQQLVALVLHISNLESSARANDSEDLRYIAEIREIAEACANDLRGVLSSLYGGDVPPAAEAEDGH